MPHSAVERSERAKRSAHPLLPAVLLVAAVGAVGGCRGGSAADMEAPKRPLNLTIFVYDRSTSIEDYQLEIARELTNSRILELDHGDRVAALQVLQLSLDEPPRRWSQPVPEKEWEDRDIASDSVTLARFLQDTRDYLRTFSDPEGRDEINGTDILSTLHDVGEEVRAHPAHRATLYVFSDMLQSNRVIDMEGLRAMPPSNWVEEAKAQGMLPDLRGLCVVVVGARVDTRAGQRVKSFWNEYFETTGAVLLDENYTYRPVALPPEPCPGARV